MILLLVQAVLAQEPTATLTLVEPLKLVEYRFRGERTGQVSLSGALRVTVTNPSTRAVDLWSWDVMGLRFYGPQGDTFLVHSCACPFLAGYGEAPGARIHLEPGASATVRIEDWGCSGGPFRPPPQGEWSVTFRLAGGAPPPQTGEPDLHAVLTGCEERLRTGTFGEGTIETAPVVVTLKRPVVRRVR